MGTQSRRSLPHARAFVRPTIASATANAESASSDAVPVGWGKIEPSHERSAALVEIQASCVSRNAPGSPVYTAQASGQLFVHAPDTTNAVSHRPRPAAGHGP